jgi:hypothetical protein
MITNKTNEAKTIVDFVKENPHLIGKFRREYDYTEEEGYTQEALIKSAEEELKRPVVECHDRIFAPKERKESIFGDESRTLIGQVFDYILRSGGESKSFKWRFHEYHR